MYPNIKGYLDRILDLPEAQVIDIKLRNQQLISYFNRTSLTQPLKMAGLMPTGRDLVHT